MKPFRIDLDNGPSEEQLALLSQRRLHIATPVFGGTPELGYVHSLLKLQGFCAQWGLSNTLDFTAAESLIQRARNTLAHRFLEKTDGTHLMFIDADISFQPQYIWEMLLTEHDIIGGSYPRKDFRWDWIAEAAKRGVAPELLPHVGGEHVYGDSKTRNVSVYRNIPLNIDYLPTGFLMISRKALEAYKAHYFDEWYWQPGTKKTEKAWEFFPVAIHKPTRNLESEDYCFTRRMNELGIKTYLAPWVDLAHIGKWTFNQCFFCSQGKIVHKELGEPETPPKEES